MNRQQLVGEDPDATYTFNGSLTLLFRKKPRMPPAGACSGDGCRLERDPEPTISHERFALHMCRAHTREWFGLS